MGILSFLFAKNKRVVYEEPDHSYGDAKPIDEVTCEDIMKYPVWVFDYDEEDYSEEQDETWLEPILDKCLYSSDQSGYVLLKIKDTKLLAFGSVDIKNGTLMDIWYFNPNDKLMQAMKTIDINMPISFVAVPEIDHVVGRIYVLLDKDDIYAYEQK